MIEIIPSKWMKNYFRKVNRQFNDREKATMIWNIPNENWNDRLDALKEIENETTDVILRNQIHDRVQCEQEEFEIFKENTIGKLVYVVEDDKSESYGYFSDYDSAYKKMIHCIDEYADLHPQFFQIKKQYVCGVSDTDEVFENSEFEHASVTFDMQGNIDSLYSSSENEIEKNWNKRFEGAFFRIPCGLSYSSV